MIFFNVQKNFLVDEEDDPLFKFCKDTMEVKI